MSLGEIHGRIANAALFYVFAMALWGFWRYIKKQNVDSSYFGATAIAEILLLIQTGLGAFLYISGTGSLLRALPHILYGVVAVLMLPAVFIYTHGDESRRTLLIYAIAYLLMDIILLRSMITGG